MTLAIPVKNLLIHYHHPDSLHTVSLVELASSVAK